MFWTSWLLACILPEAVGGAVLLLPEFFFFLLCPARTLFCYRGHCARINLLRTNYPRLGAGASENAAELENNAAQ